jgi:CrcB protein
MSPGTWVLFLIAVGFGAPARYVVDRLVTDATVGRFPWGTGVVNVSGSFILGFLTGLVLYHGFSNDARLVLGTGFCGAYTTFSTFSYETVRLVERGQSRAAALNVLLSTGTGLAAAAAGLALASL